MTLTIDLTPEEEARLRAAATCRGLEPAELVQKLLSEHLPVALDGEERARRQKVMEELVAETERLGLYR